MGIIVNFQDEQVDCSAEEIEEMLWDGSMSAQQRYELDSYAHVSFDKDPRKFQMLFWDLIPAVAPKSIFGPVTIPVSLGSEQECAYAPDKWAYLAEEQAKKQFGINFNHYSHYVYILPRSEVIHRKVLTGFLREPHFS